MIFSIDYMRNYHADHKNFCQGGIIYKQNQIDMCEFCRVKDCNFLDDKEYDEHPEEIFAEK